MIKSIYIRDFAIIKELEVSFNDGLTIITGETGSGKTLLLKALSIAFGASCDRNMVRYGCRRAIIEVIYDQSIIRRIIRDEGPSSSYLNDKPITLKKLKEQTRYAADFHGQHDQQLILNENYHIYYLDRFCNHIDQVESLKKIYDQLNTTIKKLELFESELSKANDQKELILFQISEIESISPKKNEDSVLEKEFKILSNSARITKLLNETNSSLSNGDSSINYRISTILKPIEKLIEFDDDINNIVELLKQALILLEQSSADINVYLSSFDFDSHRLIEIENRLNEIEKVKRKYGGSISAVNDFMMKIKEDIREIDLGENLLLDLKDKIESLKNSYKKISKILHNNRLVNSKILSQEIINNMNLLEMPNSKFDINISQTVDSQSFISHNDQFVKLYPDGYDQVQFYLSTNPGQPLKPLSIIASGGEVSRIMLAIKSVFQNLDPLGTLIFDEIDTGISGKAAQKVANHLKQLGKSKQVFCISHLAQIVSVANNHLHISKKVYDNSVGLELKYLNDKESPGIVKELFIGSNLIGD